MEAQIIGKKVEELIKSRNAKISEIAKKLGISEKQLKNKFEGKDEFYVSEVIELTEIFDLDIKTVAEIFFDGEIKKTKEEKDENRKAKI